VHDKAWKKLVDSGVLRPGETIEVVCDIESVFQRVAESERVEGAANAARAAVLTAKEALSRSPVSQDLRQADQGRLLAAEAVLHTAKAAYDSLERRSDAITDFIQQVKEHRRVRKDAERHECLLRWIQQQIPFIELESGSFESDGAYAARVANSESLNLTAATGIEEPRHHETRVEAIGGSGALPAERIPAEFALQEHRKRKRSSCEAVDVYRQSKRRKSSGRSYEGSSLTVANPDATGAASSALEATTGCIAIQPESKGRKVPLHEPLQPRRPLRRSARIAQQSKKPATSTQRPAPSTSTKPKKTVTNGPAKIVTRSCPTRLNQHFAAKSTSTPKDRDRGQRGARSGR